MEHQHKVAHNYVEKQDFHFMSKNLKKMLNVFVFRQRFTFQYDSDSKHTARSTMDQSIIMLEWPSQSRVQKH